MQQLSSVCASMLVVVLALTFLGVPSLGSESEEAAKSTRQDVRLLCRLMPLHPEAEVVIRVAETETSQTQIMAKGDRVVGTDVYTFELSLAATDDRRAFESLVLVRGRENGSEKKILGYDCNQVFVARATLKPDIVEALPKFLPYSESNVDRSESTDEVLFVVKPEISGANISEIWIDSHNLEGSGPSRSTGIKINDNEWMIPVKCYSAASQVGPYFGFLRLITSDKILWTFDGTKFSKMYSDLPFGKFEDVTKLVVRRRFAP